MGEQCLFKYYLKSKPWSSTNIGVLRCCWSALVVVQLLSFGEKLLQEDLNIIRE